jgi:branched-chain amino acid transport system ATP-binding protein
MLELKGVHTHRGAVHVLHGISISVEPREVVCLVGRNGAGKTTVAETIMGYLPARAGSVTFRGDEITRLPVHERARLGIGYTPDYTGIFTELTVAENLMISELAVDRPAVGGNSAKEHISAIFPEIGELSGRPGLNLSGGQRKMVAIARAMALSPTLLLLDEPFEGLAPLVVSRFTDAVIKIKELGISLLIAESHLAAASRIADRIYAIDRGEIIFHGTPDGFRQNEDVMRTVSG